MGPKKVNLTAKQRERLLRQNWHSHDSRWFLKVAQELGPTVANRLNQITVRSMGKTEAKRFLTESNSGEVKNIEDLLHLFQEMGGLYYPDFECKILDKNTILMYNTKCAIPASAPAFYECACMVRAEGCMEGLGLDAEAWLRKSRKEGDDICEGIYRIKEWKK